MTEKIKHPGKRLGKKPFKHDKRTLQLAHFLTDIILPENFDFDKGRRPFPTNLWGNDEWGDCVLAARANQFLRQERVEHRVTMHLTDQQVIDKYKHLTGSSNPGDDNDTGLVMLDANKDWANGWDLTFDNRKESVYKIAAYASVFGNTTAIKAAIRYLTGCHLGLWLPRTAMDQTTDGGTWDVVPGAGAAGSPGSWGGHAVYSFAYEGDILKVKTWGMTMNITPQFMTEYGDEAWATVDDLDSWTTSHWLNVSALKERLAEITA